MTKHFPPTTDAWLEQGDSSHFGKAYITHNAVSSPSWTCKLGLQTSAAWQAHQANGPECCPLQLAFRPVTLFLSLWSLALGPSPLFCLPSRVCLDSVAFWNLLPGLSQVLCCLACPLISNIRLCLLSYPQLASIPFSLEDREKDSNILLKLDSPGILSPTWEK